MKKTWKLDVDSMITYTCIFIVFFPSMKVTWDDFLPTLLSHRVFVVCSFGDNNQLE